MATPTSETDSPSTAPQRSPRAFAISAGWVFQRVGGMFLLGSCLIWAASGKLVAPASQPAERWLDYLHGDRLPAALLTIAIINTFVGGIALCGVGLGLSGEQRRSGQWAMAVTVCITIVYLAVAVLLALDAGRWFPALLSALLALLSLTLFALSVQSALVLRRHPPPPDQSALTEEVLEEIRRKRDERRKKFDL